MVCFIAGAAPVAGQLAVYQPQPFMQAVVCDLTSYHNVIKLYK